MLIQGPGLLVSLPPEELRGFSPPASLFQPSDLHGVALSPELRWALHAATQACLDARGRMILVARPEIFTHGMALAWLQDQLMGIGDHLALSDGTAVRPISGMRNHLFLYRRSRLHSAVAFERLIGWVPEVLDCLHSQVNSNLSARCGRRTLRPPTLSLQAGLLPDPQARIFAHRHHASLDVSVRRTLAVPAPLPRQTRQVTYVPLTESACHDVSFMRRVAAAIRAAAKRTGTTALVRMPSVGSTDDLEPRLHLALAALRGVRLNQAAKPGTLLFATDDPPVEFLAGGSKVEVLAHASYESWRYAPEYLAALTA